MRGVAVLRIVLVVVAVWAAGLPRAYARDGIVLEAYTGARPAEASKTLAPLLGELSVRGFQTGDGVGRIYDAKVSRPAGPELPGDFGAQLKAGLGAYIGGRFDEAIEKLGPLIDAAHASSGSFARNQPLRQQLTDALIALAMAQQRSGDPRAARSTLTELARSFPRETVQKSVWGPDAAKLFGEVKKELRDQGTGRLIVRIADAGAEVFVNEGFVGKGTQVATYAPGEYRVVIQQAKVQSRIHVITVVASTDTSLDIDLGFDAVVHTAPWTGFTFASATDRSRFEVHYAATLAQTMGESAVIVVGFDEVNGRTAVTGASISASGKENRRASLVLDGTLTAERLVSLARFLSGDPAPPDIDVQLVEAPGVTAPVGGDARSYSGPGMPAQGRWKGWTYIVGSLAIAAVGTGVTLLVLDGHCPDGTDNPNCPDVYSTRTPALITLGGSAVLVGLTLYLIFDRPAAASSTAYIAPTSGGAMAGYSLRF